MKHGNLKNLFGKPNVHKTGTFKKGWVYSGFHAKFKKGKRIFTMHSKTKSGIRKIMDYYYSKGWKDSQVG
jgi:hypothetical protein